MPVTRTSHQVGSTWRAVPRGFTIVELLVVIIIIGLLMALLVPAVMSARIRAIDARNINEIAQLDAAMKEFQSKYQALPPALHNTNSPVVEARVRAFWRRVWPRWNNSGTTPDDLSPAEVLVFYLGGVPSSGGSSKVTGFNLNPLDPTATGGQRSTPLFQFDQSRLKDLYPPGAPNGFYEYYPPNSDVPYAYFDSATYGLVKYDHGDATTYGTAKPYYDGATSGGFMNPNSFQIICAGQDENYGADADKVFPDGTNYGPGDNDNLVNFSTARLEEASQ